MFTAVPQKNIGVAKAYFEEHLTRNDYYSQGEVEQGRWLGKGGELLGLVEGEPVEEKKFLALCDGFDPQDGLRLTQRRNGKDNRRVFYDFTCSAPKAVSILAVAMNDERVLRAHQKAARIAATELQRYAATRIRIAGANADRRTGNVVGAEFTHNSSRALDPQLHSHFVFFNATFDGIEDRWKALQTGDMMKMSTYCTEVYRNELARLLIGIGYEIEPSKHGFGIKGVSKDLIDRFSKRSKQRDAVVKEMEKRLGRQLTNNEISTAVHRTRSRKLKGLSTAEVRERQLGEMTADEIDFLRMLKASAIPPEAQPDPGEKDAIDFAVDHVFERVSVVPEEALLKDALVHGRGRVELAALKTLLDEDRFLRVGGDITTREILHAERWLVETLAAGRDSFPPIAPFFKASAEVGDDQRRAVEHILSSSDQVTGFRGLAGSGKTTALRELAAAFEAVNVTGVFVAPTAAATDVLRRDGFSTAVTLAKLLASPKEQERLDGGGVIVLDEAGLVGLDDMQELFALLLKKRARLVFSGDTGQHSSVPRGDALRLLEDHSLYLFGELTRIRRQRTAEYRAAVECAARGDRQEAFDRFEALGWVTEPDQLYAAAAEAYFHARERGLSGLLIAPTWAEIELVTQSVRELLKDKGLIGKNEIQVPVFHSLGWTAAQKRRPAQFSEGQRILFLRPSGLYRQNEEVEVIAVTDENLRIRRQDGTESDFRPEGGTAYEVGERREIGVAAGDLILLRANRQQDGLINGQVVKVKAVRDGKIILKSGKALPDDYRQFAPGYCVTSHSAQARTVDSVFLVASSKSAAAIHAEQFYVSISRGRQECRIFTDDKELLRSRIERSSQRIAALDLLRDSLAEHGFIPKAVRRITPRRLARTRARALRPTRRLSRHLRGSIGRNADAISRLMISKLSEWSSQLRDVAKPVIAAMARKVAPLKQPKLDDTQPNL